MTTRAKLILVRHGETEGNVAKILDTALPGLPLTERGVAQAKAFGASSADTASAADNLVNACFMKALQSDLKNPKPKNLKT